MNKPLETMNDDELDALIARATAAKAANDAQRRKDVQARLEEVAAKHGYRLRDLVGAPGKPGRVVGQPKYRDPQDPARTWTGKGRKPTWFATALAEGVAADDMLI